MNAFDLKIPIKAQPSRVFDVLTDATLITKWDTCAWAHNDMFAGGKLRKRDDDGLLLEGEIVIWEPPYRFGLVWPVPIETEEPEQGTVLSRMEYRIEGAAGGSMLHLRAEGFPNKDLAEREHNNWGGWFMEKIREVAEKENEKRETRIEKQQNA